MNLYLTPAGAQGFQAHMDGHEVFVLQLDGPKLGGLQTQLSVAAGVPTH